MKEYEIQLSDLRRILIGEVPFHFYLEVIFKVALIYLILMVSMRLMGKRMSSRLSRNEMAAVASMAAAVGVPLMNPDRGLLPAVVIAAVIITYQMLIAKKASVDKKFESITQDQYDMLVKDGVLNIDAMSNTKVSRARVFAQLRSASISHLGMVKRLYFEAGGTFSILHISQAGPGLSVIPDWDRQLSVAIHTTADKQVCSYCGIGKPTESAGGKVICPNCKNKEWVEAVENRN